MSTTIQIECRHFDHTGNGPWHLLKSSALSSRSLSAVSRLADENQDTHPASHQGSVVRVTALRDDVAIRLDSADIHLSPASPRWKDLVADIERMLDNRARQAVA